MSTPTTNDGNRDEQEIKKIKKKNGENDKATIVKKIIKNLRDQIDTDKHSYSSSKLYISWTGAEVKRKLFI